MKAFLAISPSEVVFAMLINAKMPTINIYEQDKFRAQLNIDIPYFAQMISQIYPTDLQLNKANPSDTEALFWT